MVVAVGITRSVTYIIESSQRMQFSNKCQEILTPRYQFRSDQSEHLLHFSSITISEAEPPQQRLPAYDRTYWQLARSEMSING